MLIYYLEQNLLRDKNELEASQLMLMLSEKNNSIWRSKASANFWIFFWNYKMKYQW